MIDIVPNHCSSAHPWFQAALAAGPGSPERELFHFRSSDALPNNWQSIFRGPAWTQLPDGDWYLHLFAPEQPDLNWDHPTVRRAFTDILRFWLDRGVDGIRIDVAHGLVKASGLPDAASDSPDAVILVGDRTPFFDQDGVHEIYREWRSMMDTYTPERIAVAEAWLPDPARMALYVRPDELHQAFNFAFLGAPWSGPTYRQVIDESLAAMSTVDAPTTWVLSNHDVVRHATRLAAGVGGTAGGAPSPQAYQGDPRLGRARARAATLLMLALPGSAYLYQGEELGLPEVFDLPAAVRQDPIFLRSNGEELGRDGCRVPLPWSGTEPPYGFGPPGSTPWLPQPHLWGELSVAAQQADPDSTLALYRAALRLRRELFTGSTLTWVSAPGDDLLVFDRDGIRVAINQGPAPAFVAATTPLLSSQPLIDGELPPDSAAWWRRTA